MRLIIHFFRVSAINASILFNKSTPDNQLTLFQFLLALVKAWCKPDTATAAHASTTGLDLPAGKSGQKMSRAWWESQYAVRCTGSHAPRKVLQKGIKRIRGDPNAMVDDTRDRCKLCGKKTPFVCKSCGVSLHIDDGSGDLLLGDLPHS